MKHPLKFTPRYLTKAEIRDPFQATCNFYFEYDLCNVRDTIDDWLNDIYNPPNWNKKCPGNLLHFYENILKLIEACRIIKKMDTRNRLANISDTDELEGDLLSPGFYCLPVLRDISWNYFPRSLSWKEYLRPYKVFNGFFKFHTLEAWKEVLHDLLHTALIGRTLQPTDEIFDLLGIRLHLNKLTEAIHLIYIREFAFTDEVREPGAPGSEEDKENGFEKEEADPANAQCRFNI